jgi:predicted lipoprotein with Yx(FWY)xxD motif
MLSWCAGTSGRFLRLGTLCARARKHRSPYLLGAAAIASITLCSCAGGSYSVTGASNTTTDSSTNGTVDVRYVKGFGNILVTSRGYALYLLTSDPRNASSCVGSCVLLWAPFEVTGKLEAGAGVNPKLLSSFERSGGAHQVAYNGHALYTYSDDTGPGMVTGEGVETYGGIWWAVSPKGNPVEK